MLTRIRRLSGLRTGNVNLPILLSNPVPQTDLFADYNPIFGANVYNGLLSSLENQANSAAGPLLAAPAARPVLTLNDLNGFPTITHDGTAQFLQAIFTLPQPYTLYFVSSILAWVANATLIDGVVNNTGRLYMSPTTPNIRLSAGTAGSSTAMTVGETVVDSAVFNGASSVLQVSNLTPVTGNFGSASPGGVTVGRSGQTGGFSNIKWERLLFYSVAHTDSQRAAIVAALRAMYLI